MGLAGGVGWGVGAGATGLATFGGMVGGAGAGITGRAAGDFLDNGKMNNNPFGVSDITRDAGIGAAFGSVVSFFNRNNIVGTDHKGALPRQTKINPDIVKQKVALIKGGARPLIRINRVQGLGDYLGDTHHTYVAYKKVGFAYKDIPKDIATFSRDDYIAYLPLDKQISWPNVKPYSSWKHTRRKGFDPQGG